MNNIALFFGRSDNRQNIDEDIDNVQVQSDRSKNILFGTNRMLVSAAHHHLSVVDQVNTEEQSSTR